MKKFFDNTRYIFLMVTYAILVVPLSLFLLISDIREENELISKY